MKNIAFIMTFVALFAANIVYSQTVTFTVTTATDNGSYSPKNILAIKSCKVMAGKRIQYLYTWNTKSKQNIVDAVTGSTLMSHQTHTITWNCKGTDGKIVKDGPYKMKIEYTDKHAQGPIYSIDFSVSGTSQHVAPPDQTYFKKMVLDFTAPTTGITQTIANQNLVIQPNPTNGVSFINYTSDNIGNISLNVIDISGRIVLTKSIASDQLTNYPIDLSKYGKGVYIIQINQKNKSVSRKVVVR